MINGAFPAKRWKGTISFFDQVLEMSTKPSWLSSREEPWRKNTVFKQSIAFRNRRHALEFTA